MEDKLGEFDLNKVYCMDCLEILKQIPDNSVDLVLTDPPYQLDHRKLKQIELHGRKAFLHNFKELKAFDDCDIKQIYDKVFPELNRIVKDTGSILMFARNELVTWCIDSAKVNNFDVKCTIVWHKTNPMPQIRKVNYLSSTESIIWLARWHPTKMLFTFNFKKQNEMHNFIEFPICSGKERTSHPTQKPLKLIKHLLEIHSNPGDIVLDCFAGSGTTGVACLELGRKFILIERESKYCDMARNRILPYLEQRKL